MLDLLWFRVGLLINAPDKHSKYFTSPLKYFEYLAASLNVVAIDFPSHRVLPNQENVFYFKLCLTPLYIQRLLMLLSNQKEVFFQ